MATTTTHDESFEESSDPIKYKKLVLRVSIDCEGCRKRVNKILSKVPGVQEVDINLKQQMVTVIGDVDGVFLLKKLRKSGRQVELLPEMNPETVTSKQPVKTKDKGKQPMQDNKEENCRTTSSSNNDGKHAGKTQQPQVKPQVSQDPAANVKTTGGGDESAESSASPGEKTDGVSPSEEVIQESSKESNKSEPESESKSEGKKPVGGELPLAEEKKHVDGENSTPEKVDSGNISKKKKKGGQNGNKLSSSVSDAATDNSVVLPNYSLPANNVLPRDLRYYGYPPDLYTSPPVYAASYNTSHASSSPTTSYYAQQPADSYVYAYSGPGIEPTPSDLDAYNRQPLDSLEMFSDENPNGCSIM